MSVVTDVMVTYYYERSTARSGEQWMPKAMLQLNEWLASKGGPLAYLDFHKIPHGGTKVFQSNIWVGAYNYIDIDDLLQTFAWCDWSSPETAQIMYHYEHDPVFVMHTAESLRDRYPHPDEGRAPVYREP